MRVALLIGIDDYNSAAATPLRGCVSDAKEMKRLLQHDWDRGEPNFQCRLVVSGDDKPLVTTQIIREEISRALTSEADVVWIHFSGHGGIEGEGEASEGVLLAQDGHHVKMDTVLEMIRTSPARQKILTLDCCAAGRAGIDEALGDDVSLVPERCAILAAARADQNAEESYDGGRFTSHILAALDGGAADVMGSVTVAGLYGFLDEAFPFFDQRPVLKASLTRLVKLRECRPDVDRKILRRLPEWFERPEDIYGLDRRYEPTEDQYEPARGEIFAGLQACARARLIEPVDAEHMYYAAVTETGCKLTARGKRYWRLAKEDRI